MQNIPNHIIEQARQTNLVTLAERYGLRLTKESVSSWACPCPACGGTDRFWIRDNRYKCRDSAGCGIHGDSISFVQLQEKINFMEAVQRLTGYDAGRPARAQRPRLADIPPVPKASKRPETPTAAQMAQYGQICHEAHCALLDGAYASDGRDYLLGRGLEPDVWAAYRLGFRADVFIPVIGDRAPAISMPWYRQGKVWGIRYRFLQNYQSGERKIKQTSEKGSIFKGGLYGGHALPGFISLPADPNGRRAEDLRTLVLCEGEMNAISIWQVTNDWGWDVLSIGSEATTITPGAVEFALGYGRVLLWVDRDEVARSLVGVLGCPAVSSPTEGDANDLLQKGSLGAFLAGFRLKACKSPEERRRFVYDLTDADQRLPGLDERTRTLIK